MTEIPPHGIINPSDMKGNRRLNTDYEGQSGGRAGIIMFKMEGCGWCEKTKKELHRLVHDYKRPVMYVDSRSELTSKFRPAIDGFPTIYIVRGNGMLVPEPYEGERTPDAFESILRQYDHRR